MREQEVNARIALSEFNDIAIRLKSLDSRYRKDCITDEEMAKQIQDLRQTFIEKSQEMTSLFKSRYFKESLVANLVAKYKQKFEYNPEEVFTHLDQLYADFMNLHHASLKLFLDGWSDSYDEEAEKKYKAQLETLDNLIKIFEARKSNYNSRVAKQNEAAEKAQKAEEEKQAKKKQEKPEAEKPEEDKKQGKKKGKGAKKVKGVILKAAPRSGSKIYYVKNSETRAKEAAAQREATKAMSKPAHQPALAPRQMSR